MARKAAKNDTLIAETDALVRDLLARVNSGKSTRAAATGGASDLVDKPALVLVEDQIDALVAVTKYLHARNRIRPDEDEPSDFLSRARREISTGTGTAGAPSAVSGARSAAQRRARRPVTPVPAPVPAPAEGQHSPTAAEGAGLQFGRTGLGPVVALPDGGNGTGASHSVSPTDAATASAPEAGS